MTLKFAQYEHRTIGFPKVVLKWTEEDGKLSRHEFDFGAYDAYVVISGRIFRGWNFKFSAAIHREAEMKTFDDWVRQAFCDNPELQG